MVPMDLDIFIENKKLNKCVYLKILSIRCWFKMTKTGNYLEEIIFQEFE